MHRERENLARPGVHYGLPRCVNDVDVGLLDQVFGQRVTEMVVDGLRGRLFGVAGAVRTLQAFFYQGPVTVPLAHQEGGRQRRRDVDLGGAFEYVDTDMY
jgi:hypothetical protein